MTQAVPSAVRRGADVPFWLPLLAGAPLVLCMAVMALPELGHGRAVDFRVLYAITYLLWIVPMAAAQRWLRRRGVSWLMAVPVLLALSYAMSLANNALGELLAIQLGALPRFQWAFLFAQLDGCWLALIAFGAVHAVVEHYIVLQAERERVREIAAQARDAELRALRYQLQPHFLFNTLNAISALVAGQRNAEANRMLATLGELLRATLDSGESHEVALAEELALAGLYLDIEKVRLGNRLLLDVRIGPEVLQSAVPPLLLQPLLENAIRHGIALRTAPGRVALAAERDGETLRLSLRNDGAPAASDATGDETRPAAIGLRNVRERLVQLHGEQQRFEFALGDDGSCTVDIAFPFRAIAEPA
ncbi:histidine kinase [Rhodanobacter sp. 7MK24]|uniref:sensor histidine kinase n=1 Tax=Rhodanobacter sp. 7MK24 TaxID=2775922 RepID=UPI001781CCD9|nr:histidine kinase [Rhodanobacter sp. 7MK24]MBD8882173.1 histidine kinase [Rhodanobacter sp. 7MK24]